METLKAVFFGFLSWLFSAYRVFISPVLSLAFNIHCRFEETCSRYTERLIRERGFFAGVLLGSKRILSCNKWSGNG